VQNSSLFGLVISNEEKHFITLTPGHPECSINTSVFSCPALGCRRVLPSYLPSGLGSRQLHGAQPVLGLAAQQLQLRGAQIQKRGERVH
jgi:hypothetical protein